MQNPIQHLYFRSRISPEKLCLVTDSEKLNYGQVLIITRKISSALNNLGLDKGDFVQTLFTDPAMELLITLAAFNSGLITCSLHNTKEINKFKPKILLTNIQKIANIDQNILYLDENWIKNAVAGEKKSPATEYDSQNITRLVLSSGTTGESKAVPITYDNIKLRTMGACNYWVSASPETNLQELSTIGGIFTALERLYLGLPIYLSANKVALFEKQKISALTGSPIQISYFIDKLIEVGNKTNQVNQITVSGGMLSPKLFDKISNFFNSSEIRNVYGTTETGGVYLNNISNERPIFNAGIILPDVQVEIDNTNQGDEGLIKIKTSSMAKNYYQDNESTLKSFKDDWFYPGDIGKILNNHLLVISGRDSDIANIGGIKANLISIDQYISNFEGVLDNACFTHENKVGILEIGCGLVVNDKFDFDQFKKSLAKKYGTRLITAFMKLKEIPRNNMGKVLRQNLSYLYENQKN